MTYDYIRDGTAIYERSFGIIRSEADLNRFSEDEAQVAVRMIHGCGLVEAAGHIHFAPGFVTAAREALRSGAPVLCDAQMVAHGVTHARLPAQNEVICALGDPALPELALKLGTTRSAAGMELLRRRMDGALVAVGNAPTALFHLLEMITAGAPHPAAIIGMPVGFVGAAESKEALRTHASGIPWAIVEGRMGGSAMTASAINAIARAGL